MATKFHFLPDVIDVTFVFTAAGGVGLMATVVGAALQVPAERVGRMVVFGQLVGFVAGTIVFVVGLIANKLRSVRYLPYIALTLAGLALGIAGAVSLGIGAVYGGVAVCGLSAVTAFGIHQRQTAAGAKRHEQSADAHHHGSGAAAVQ